MQSRLAFVAAAVTAVLLAATAQAQMSTIPIALTGEPAPGAPGRTFYLFGDVAIHDSGQVIFGAFLNQEDTTNDLGIWIGTPGNLVLAVREGDEAPGTGGKLFEAFTPEHFLTRFNLKRPQMNSTGEFVFVGVLKGEETTRGGGVWSGTPGNLRLVARAGDPAPGAPGRTFASFHIPYLDEAGNVLFRATLDDLSQSLWYSGPNGLVGVVVNGQPAPGGSGRTFYYPGGTDSYTMSPDGRIIVRASFEERLSPFDVAVWAGDPENLQLLAESGSVAPGAEEGFNDLGAAQILDDGTALVLASVGLRGETSRDVGYWMGAPGSLLPVDGARAGEPAPGTALPFQFMGLPTMNDARELVFLADLDPTLHVNPTDFGIWTGTSGNLRLIARQYDPAPGADATFRPAGGNTNPFQSPSISALGTVAFEAGLLTSDSRAGYGLWVWRDGELQSVANTTVPFVVDRCDVRRMHDVDFNTSGLKGGTGLGGIYGMNAHDQIAFLGSFQEGAAGAISGGVFVTGEPPPDDGEPCPIPPVPPSITITSPVNEEEITTPEILVEGTASDDSEVVSVVVNGVEADLVSTGNPDAPAEVSFSVRIPRGPDFYTLIDATATDDSANETQAYVFVYNGEIEGPLVCDANGDGSVDRVDIGQIFAARGSVASGPDDPRDVNGDGLISINDGRLCVLECTNPGCAPAAR
jgi:hypothetical protein